MMDDTRYADVKAAIARLVAEGVPASKDRIREAVGGGSYATLYPLIKRAKIELGLAEDEGTIIDASFVPVMNALPLAHGTAPDPERIQQLSADLASETAYHDVQAHVAHVIAHLDLLREAIPLARPWAQAHGLMAQSTLNLIPLDDLRRVRPVLRRALLLATKREGDPYGSTIPAASSHASRPPGGDA